MGPNLRHLRSSLARLEDLQLDAELEGLRVHVGLLHALDGRLGRLADDLLHLALAAHALAEDDLRLGGLLAERDAVAVAGVAVDVAVVDGGLGAVHVKAGDDDADTERAPVAHAELVQVVRQREADLLRADLAAEDELVVDGEVPQQLAHLVGVAAVAGHEHDAVLADADDLVSTGEQRAAVAVDGRHDHVAVVLGGDDGQAHPDRDAGELDGGHGARLVEVQVRGVDGRPHGATSFSSTTSLWNVYMRIDAAPSLGSV